MARFYRIAGLTVEMDSFGRTVKQAEPYRIQPPAPEEKAELVIRSDWQSLKREQPGLSDEDCEYLMTGASFYRQLLAFQGMLLHSSAVVKDGKAYLFTAPCGTGKSTHTRLWLECFSDAYILNDDKPALRLEDGCFYAYGTPWSGKDDSNTNVRVPLGGICVLRRGAENRISSYGGKQAIHDILEQTIRPKDAGALGKLLDVIESMVLQVPIWKLECNMEPEAAYISYNTMAGRIDR